MRDGGEGQAGGGGGAPAAEVAAQSTSEKQLSWRRSKREKIFSTVGTPDYIAPEVLTHKGHNHAVDWWALGVLAFEMLHGEPPFMAEEQMATFKRIQNGQYRVARHLPAEAADLIARLLCLSPAKRLGMRSGEVDVAEHPFVGFGAKEREALMSKRMLPPYVPNLAGTCDTCHFDALGLGGNGSHKCDKFLSKKYDETWEKEFGPMVGA